MAWGCGMKKTIRDFYLDEKGATAIEYGLIAALIAVGIIAAAMAMAEAISMKFDSVEELTGP